MNARTGSLLVVAAAVILPVCDQATTGPCPDPQPMAAVGISSAHGIKSGEPIARLTLSDLTLNGLGVPPSSVIFSSSSNVTVDRQFIVCFTPCTFGADSGTYRFTVRAPGYYAVEEFVTGKAAADPASCASPAVPEMTSLELVEADSAQVSFDLSSIRPVGLTRDALTVRFNDGTGSREIKGPDLPGPHRTANAGELHIEFAVIDGDTLAADAFMLPLRLDWIHSIRVVLAIENPTDECFGCTDSWSVPLRWSLEGVDSAFVLIGGNSLSDPVVY